MLRSALAAILLAASLATVTAATIENPEAGTGDAALDAQLAAEKEARKACKIEICGILRSKQADGPNVACRVTQTVTKKAFDGLFDKAKLKWPLGNAVCKTDLKIARATLVKAMSEANFVAEFEPHKLDCEIAAAEAGGDATKISIVIKPTVTFAGGKATKAVFNWGEIAGPALVKGVVWPTVTLDNTVGLFGGKFTEMVNSFLTKSCDEVKDQLPTN